MTLVTDGWLDHHRPLAANNFSQVNLTSPDKLLEGLIDDAAGGGEHHRPLAALMRSILQKAYDLGVATPADFMTWLEAAIPQELSPEAGTASPSAAARLADSIDELDGIILPAI